MDQFRDRLPQTLREFGNDEMRKLRHVIETTDPVMLDRDMRYHTIMAKMAKQKQLNSNSPHAIRRALINNRGSQPETMQLPLHRRHNSIVVNREEKL